MTWEPKCLVQSPDSNNGYKLGLVLSLSMTANLFYEQLKSLELGRKANFLSAWRTL